MLLSMIPVYSTLILNSKIIENLSKTINENSWHAVSEVKQLICVFEEMNYQLESETLSKECGGHKIIYLRQNIIVLKKFLQDILDRLQNITKSPPKKEVLFESFLGYLKRFKSQEHLDAFTTNIDKTYLRIYGKMNSK